MSHQDARENAIASMLDVIQSIQQNQPVTYEQLDRLLTDLKNAITTDPVAEPASRGNGNWQGT